MEPFRILIDRIVYDMNLIDFEHEQKMKLVNVLNIFSSSKPSFSLISSVFNKELILIKYNTSKNSSNVMSIVLIHLTILELITKSLLVNIFLKSLIFLVFNKPFYIIMIIY